MISRSRYIQKIEKGFENNLIVVLIGARQVGKTSLMQMYSQSHKSFWINGENPETAQLFQRLSDVERYLKININSILSGFLIILSFYGTIHIESVPSNGVPSKRVPVSVAESPPGVQLSGLS